MNTAIIVAAGEGTRFGGDRSKQFVEILGIPLIVHTLERFERCSAVDEIVLVLSADGAAEFEIWNSKCAISKLVKTVPGGKTRAESVRNGFLAVDPKSDVVAVHDGARPLVTADEIERTIAKAAETGAACLVAEMTDTVKSISKGNISGTVDRKNLRRALTPQAFRYEVLARALESFDLGENITDECCLVEKLGVRIAAIEGSPRNIKITRPDDLHLAEVFLKEQMAAHDVNV